MQKKELQVYHQYDLFYLFSYIYNIHKILYIYYIVMKNKTQRKWTLKYKRSINCKKPKGFSQRQYCKYGKRPKTLKKRK